MSFLNETSNTRSRTMNTKSYAKTRFSPNDSALVLIDHQSGIMQLVHDYSPAEFRNNVMARRGSRSSEKSSTYLPS
jgi:hypothetical protein